MAVSGIARRHSAAHGQQRKSGQHGDDGDVLEEEHGKAALAARTLHLPFLIEALEDDGRGGEGQGEADGQGHVPAQAQGDADAGDGRGRGADLQAAHAQDRAAQPPEQRGLQLQAHQEEHHDHAELGEVHHVLPFLADQAQGEWSDERTGDQIAEHRTQAESFGHGHGDDGGGQIHESLEEEAVAMHGDPPAESRSKRR